MSSGIFTGKAGELIFHNKIQAALISQDSTSLRGSIRVLRKSLLLVLVKSHNLVVSWAIATNKQIAHKQTRRQWKREEIGKERANKTARWSGGEENERQMTNNINAREMGLWWVLWYVLTWAKTSPATAPEILLATSWACVGFPWRGKGDAAQ